MTLGGVELQTEACSSTPPSVTFCQSISDHLISTSISMNSAVSCSNQSKVRSILVWLYPGSSMHLYITRCNSTNHSTIYTHHIHFSQWGQCNSNRWSWWVRPSFMYSNTVKLEIFARPLFREFRDLDKFAKITGREYSNGNRLLSTSLIDPNTKLLVTGNTH